jgi:RNA polymerase sigma factor
MTDSIKLNDHDCLMREYKPFILRTASFVLKRYVSDSDDAWSIALIAFWEAVEHHDPKKGDFQKYAQMVIKRRLIDYQRRQNRYRRELDVTPEAFTGETDQESDPLSRVLAFKSRASLQEESLKDELDDASKIFDAYGFAFIDLVDCSPKSEKTRSACAQAVACMLRFPELILKMRHMRRLPITAISIRAHLPLKLLNRHRRYIIAVVEILGGDYPGLTAYLDFVRKG